MRTVRTITTSTTTKTVRDDGFSNYVIAALARIERKIDQLDRKLSVKMDAIKAAVEAETTVVQSAVTLLTQLHDLLVAAGTDPALLADLAATIKSNTDALAAAVLANTPAAPPV